MKIVERKQVILNELREHGKADINQLAEDLDVSSMTIRRDLKKLVENGTVTISQGVAVLNDGTLQEYTMEFKHQTNLEEKRRIARKAFEFVSEGESVFLDAGTTVKELAQLMNRMKNVNIMTHSLLAANAVTHLNDNARLIMCPGEYREMSLAYMGPLTDDFVQRFQIDVLFLSTEGVSLSGGVTVIDVLDGHTKRTLINQAHKTICLVDSSKFEKSYFYRIAPLSSIDLIITDTGLNDELFEEYQQAGVNVIRV